MSKAIHWLALCTDRCMWEHHRQSLRYESNQGLDLFWEHKNRKITIIFGSVFASVYTNQSPKIWKGNRQVLMNGVLIFLTFRNPYEASTDETMQKVSDHKSMLNAHYFLINLWNAHNCIIYLVPFIRDWWEKLLKCQYKLAKMTLFYEYSSGDRS